MHEHEVAGERQVCTRAERGTVHRRDGWFVELPELANERLDAGSQRFRGQPRPEVGLTGLCDRRRRQVHAGAERVPFAGDEHRAHCGIGAELTNRVDNAVAHYRRECILRGWTVEDDTAHTVLIDLDSQLAHRCRSWRLQRRAAWPRSLLGWVPASRRSLIVAALGACSAGPFGPARCSAGYPPRDARSSLPLLALAAPGRLAPLAARLGIRLATL